MSWKSILRKTALGLCLVTGAWGGTFGKVVAIGGQPADIALDEMRGVLYIANFTANRIDVMSLANNTIQSSMNVASQPSSIAISPDGRYLVVAHFGNFTSPNTPRNAITVINLAANNSRQTWALTNPPLGIAFGYDNKALVVTSKEFLLLDPALGVTQSMGTIADIPVKTLPQPPATYPTEIVSASVVSSRDYRVIHGVTDTILFTYNAVYKTLSGTLYTATPPLGPRTISTNKDGSNYLAGWGMFDRDGMIAQFPDPDGNFNTGGHVFDDARGLIYAQIPKSGETSIPRPAPVLQVVASDNLEVLERLQIPENLAGKALITSDGNTVYASSDSGVLVLPVGQLNAARRITSSKESLLFTNNYCERQIQTQDITIMNPGGGAVDFQIQPDTQGITVSPTSGTTPATVRVRVDPGAFQNMTGTTTANLTITSAGAVNIPNPVKVLVNMADPDQRGTIFNVPGKLVDILADPFQQRFFLLRQDTNEVLVYDGKTFTLIARLRTGNTPTQMALSFDRRYLLVGNDNSQIANVYDLETLESAGSIRFPGGHYPRSIAAAGGTILAACRVAGPKNTIDRIDFSSRVATQFPTLGVFDNDIDINTQLIASSNGGSILAAEADGNVLLFDTNANTFTVSRKDANSLSGAYAASDFGQFLIGSTVYNNSVVPIQTLANSVGSPSGFEYVDQLGFRTGATDAASPGIIERYDLENQVTMRSTRMAEAPVLPDTSSAFTRTVAVLNDRSALINLTTSGFTVLAWNYDLAVQAPQVDSVVNAADFSAPVAPGGLVSVFGTNLSPVNAATSTIPLPTALGDTCLTVNGLPVSMLYVSPTQINAQLPNQVLGNTTMVLHTPGGVSDNFNFTILPNAPSIFRVSGATSSDLVPTVVRLENNLLVTPSNPVRNDDVLVIYMTGGGRTAPEIPAGTPAPADPLASTLVQPTVTLGGVALPVLYSGLTPGSVGLYQINARVPFTVPKGMSEELRVTQGSVSTSVTVRVVE